MLNKWKRVRKMSFDKHMGKEHRKPYYKTAQRVDKTCRNHGTCAHCLSNRQYSSTKQKAIAKSKLDEWDESLA